jgi:hypothetical protein
MLAIFCLGTVPIKRLQHDTHNSVPFRPELALPCYTAVDD